MMNPKRLVGVLFLIAVGTAQGQSNFRGVMEVLQRQVHVHQTVAYQLREYLFRSIPNLFTVRKADTAADKLRSCAIID